jgi:ribA/ribD-fused uncharacterized protein
MKYGVQWLPDKNQKGEKLKFVFFWGHQARLDGSIGESCFSQWWPSAFTVAGVVYQTAEHWMKAQKARLFNDEETLTRILDCTSPAEAKKLGRMAKVFDPVLWDAHKYELVKQSSYHKFSQHPDLREFLLRTYDRVLVEASPVDPIWGVGMAKTDKNIHNPSDWKGENLLGFALMEVRDDLNAGI